MNMINVPQLAKLETWKSQRRVLNLSISSQSLEKYLFSKIL